MILLGNAVRRSALARSTIRSGRCKIFRLPLPSLIGIFCKFRYKARSTKRSNALWAFRFIGLRQLAAASRRPITLHWRKSPPGLVPVELSSCQNDPENLKSATFGLAPMERCSCVAANERETDKPGGGEYFGEYANNELGTTGTSPSGVPEIKARKR